VAIRSFNDALQAADAANDDSIFATLLVFCLMYLVDGGFGKFKTQVAAVKKLLAVRNHGAAASDTEAIKWIEPWFTWFDVMACTVNDSEDQVRSEVLNALDLSAYIGSLEHLAGCNNSLFKLAARLDGFDLSAHRLSPARDFYSLSSARETSSESAAPQSFWKPLLDVQTRLSSWASHPQFPATQVDHATVHHISESFRHAAIIYAERQLYPHLPASMPQIQALVAPALCSLNSIRADSCINQFLLWPLLIVSAECVHAPDREIIRQRLATATPNYFFASSSCVEVLNQLWSLADASMSGGCFSSYVRESWPRLNVLGVQASRWNDAMAVLENEYLFP
jgi:hypothetical protein